MPLLPSASDLHLLSLLLNLDYAECHLRLLKRRMLVLKLKLYRRLTLLQQSYVVCFYFACVHQHTCSTCMRMRINALHGKWVYIYIYMCMPIAQEHLVTRPTARRTPPPTDASVPSPAAMTPTSPVNGLDAAQVAQIIKSVPCFKNHIYNYIYKNETCRLDMHMKIESIYLFLVECPSGFGEAKCHLP